MTAIYTCMLYRFCVLFSCNIEFHGSRDYDFHIALLDAEFLGHLDPQGFQNHGIKPRIKGLLAYLKVGDI